MSPRNPLSSLETQRGEASHPRAQSSFMAGTWGQVPRARPVPSSAVHCGDCSRWSALSPLIPHRQPQGSPQALSRALLCGPRRTVLVLPRSTATLSHSFSSPRGFSKAEASLAESASRGLRHHQSGLETRDCCAGDKFVPVAFLGTYRFMPQRCRTDLRRLS